MTVIKSKRRPARRIMVSNLVWRIFTNLAESSKSDWIFYNKKTGKKLGDFKRAWWTALEKAGIKDFHFHDIRHTFATELSDLGGREFTVQTAPGHSEIKTTRSYTHVKDAVLRHQLNELGEKQPLNHFYTNCRNNEKRLTGKSCKSFSFGYKMVGAR